LVLDPEEIVERLRFAIKGSIADSEPRSRRLSSASADRRVPASRARFNFNLRKRFETMPRARASRTAEPESYADSASDTEPEEDETPRKGAPRSRVKRRVSAYALDATDTASQGQISTGQASTSTSAIRSLNDDLAEKRMRRKSHKLNVVADPSTSTGSAADGDGDDPHRTPKKKGTGKGNAPRTPGRTGTLLNAVDRTPIPVVPIEISTSNFEEWMKLATDNVGKFSL